MSGTVTNTASESRGLSTSIMVSVPITVKMPEMSCVADCATVPEIVSMSFVKRLMISPDSYVSKNFRESFCSLAKSSVRNRLTKRCETPAITKPCIKIRTRSVTYTAAKTTSKRVSKGKSVVREQPPWNPRPFRRSWGSVRQVLPYRQR